MRIVPGVLLLEILFLKRPYLFQVSRGECSSVGHEIYALWHFQRSRWAKSSFQARWEKVEHVPFRFILLWHCILLLWHSRCQSLSTTWHGCIFMHGRALDTWSILNSLLLQRAKTCHTADTTKSKAEYFIKLEKFGRNELMSHYFRQAKGDLSSSTNTTNTLRIFSVLSFLFLGKQESFERLT